MLWNVLVTASPMAEVGQEALDLLSRAGCRISRPPRPGRLTAEELPAALTGMDAVLAGLDSYSAGVFTSTGASALKIISRWGVGYDAIDVPAATHAGVVIAYTPGMLDEAVADCTFALLLSLSRGIHRAHTAMAAGRWVPEWGSDVHGKTLGILGCGRIGTAVARRATGFGMKLLATDPQPSAAALQLGVEFVPLDQLLARSDFLTLHAALTPGSTGVIGENQIRLMKPSACLINTARGALVDEAALTRALAEGRIAGAALDAFAVEPLPLESPLRGAPNLLLTPHIASASRETGRCVSLSAASAIVDLMEGRRPPLVVNPAVFESSALRARLDGAR